jgi:hypothetical protein
MGGIMKYKKYILFQFHHYYPGGGLGDITKDSDDLEELKKYAKKDQLDTNEIIDRETWETIWELP